jgi:hypothetical protein
MTSNVAGTGAALRLLGHSAAGPEGTTRRVPSTQPGGVQNLRQHWLKRSMLDARPAGCWYHCPVTHVRKRGALARVDGKDRGWSRSSKELQIYLSMIT